MLARGVFRRRVLDLLMFGHRFNDTNADRGSCSDQKQDQPLDFMDRVFGGLEKNKGAKQKSGSGKNHQKYFHGPSTISDLPGSVPGNTGLNFHARVTGAPGTGHDLRSLSRVAKGRGCKPRGLRLRWCESINSDDRQIEKPRLAGRG